MGSGRDGFCRCHEDEKFLHRPLPVPALAGSLCMVHRTACGHFFASRSGPHLQGRQASMALPRMDTINAAAKPRETWVPLCGKAGLLLCQAFVPPESDPVIPAERPKASRADCGVLDQHARPVRCSQSPETLCKSSDRGELAQVLGRITVPHHYDGRDPRGQHQQP